MFTWKVTSRGFQQPASEDLRQDQAFFEPARGFLVDAPQLHEPDCGECQSVQAWERLDQILAGQYHLPGAKVLGGPPERCVVFFEVGGVPMEVKAQWFLNIIEGRLDLKRLGDTADRTRLSLP